ncbi:hypothetical protein P3T76_010576 [Phytophthora citrophthora]|uniref:Uncharacterized protein n=1 Tax=Phytophthora citrophthora TaxID=4793 RepID=A0AAD9GBE0_9STRA|nr:hypothetical protein P3T76_010576 [Phytophthora citrophthora]
MMEEAGLVAGEFDPNSLFDMELDAIQSATQDLFDSLKILVGERPQTPDLGYQTGSSRYASATSEPDSDSSRGPQRMSLGPSGAKFLKSSVKKQDTRSAAVKSEAKTPDQQENRRIPADQT